MRTAICLFLVLFSASTHAQSPNGTAARRPAQTASGDDMSGWLSTPAPAMTTTDDPWVGWPGRYDQYVGYETGTTTVGIIGRDLIVYGTWDGESGTEYFLGFEKPGDSYTKTSTTSQSGVATTSQTEAVTQSGSKSSYVLTLGAGKKQKIHQGRWVQVYMGYFGGMTYLTPATTPVGNRTKTTSNISNPDNYTITESGIGESKVKTDPILFGGVKLGSEFYLRWFPNLAIGFSTGLLLAAGGKKTTETSTETQTYSVVGGVPQTPTSHSGSKSEAVTDPGLTSDTFGIGGTSFQFNGLFTIRYVW